MLGIIRGILGVVVTGAGTFVPLKLAGHFGSSAVKASDVISQAIGLSEKKVAYKETKHHKALNELSKKSCYHTYNPQNSTWFETLYICKEENDVAAFYYLDKEGSARVGESLAKKISTVNYLVESDKAYLQLKLENGQSIKWGIVAGSGWEHFKEVNPSKQCKITTLKLGGDALSCEISDTSSYNYSII